MMLASENDLKRSVSLEGQTMSALQVPLIIRGEVILADDLEFGGRRGGTVFKTADVKRHMNRLVLSTPSSLSELYSLKVDQILDFLAELAGRLDFATNPYLQEAFEVSRQTSGLGEETLRRAYQNMHRSFDKAYLREMTERTVGSAYLDGWVSKPIGNGAEVAIRAFGARTVHVVAGNSPGVSVTTVARNAITRGDAIIKAPSNDPLTAAAIARTMIDMAPDHPVTRHLSVAYWKGGDEEVEQALYTPRNIEKIVAWGGFASVSHIAKYIQPGIDLITLDPKLSSTIIGQDAFADESVMRQVAERVALDVGSLNQEACVNARVVYIETGSDAAGVAKANRFGEMVYQALQALPSFLSSPAKQMDPDLAEELAALKFLGDQYKLIGGGLEGGVIVSQFDEPVDFARLLANRVTNLVPVDSVETPIRAVTAYTQTIGIYPENLKEKIRDRLAFHGSQRLVSLGYAAASVTGSLSGAQDGIEPMRRMCKWIVDESSDPEKVPLASHA